MANEVLRALGLVPPIGMASTADHVEVKVAAIVRRPAVRDVTLVINNDPCRKGPLSCSELIPQVLRAGQTITVYWPGGWQTYRGKDA